MTVLFISHSSKDDKHVASLEAWLELSGFTQVFADHKSIKAGDKWRVKLRESTRSCRVVICVVTDHWLQSSECIAEYDAARYIGKRIICLLLIDPLKIEGEELQRRFSQISQDASSIDLTRSIVEGKLKIDAISEIAESLLMILRAAGASQELGLDPSVFEIDRDLRPVPFPGLVSYGDSDADAAIFYGRSGEIARVLDELRKQRASADQRPLVILGASGAGKSSLLKAGIIPRLRREGPAWLPLRAFRPAKKPLFQFARAISQTWDDFGAQQPCGEIYDRLLLASKTAERDPTSGRLTVSGSAKLEAALEFEGQSLRSLAGRPNASILVSVDQAEELMGGDEETADALASYLRVALHSGRGKWSLAFTVRTDNFSELQSHRRFQNLEARGYDLRAIPYFRFNDVIEEPARRYGVEVERRLVDQIVEDAPKNDAMPLLAFVMQRLWNEHARSGRLTLDHYRALQGLGGLLDDAAERALRGLRPGEEVPSVRVKSRVLAMAQDTFVPAMVEINEAGSAVRRAVAWTEFTSNQHRLLGKFEDWYLVTTALGDGEVKTVEVAHDTLFEKWERLRHWLEPERARLGAIRLLKSSSSSWDRHGRRDDYLEHWQAGRLREAHALRHSPRYGARLRDVDRAYLDACEQVALKDASRRGYRRAIAAMLLLIITLGAIGWAKQDWAALQWKLYTKIRPFMESKIRPYAISDQAEATLRPGQTFRECAEDVACPLMVVIPAGSFMMGSKDGRENETPVHQVTVDRFAVGKFEITFDEWDACAANGWCKPNPEKFGRGKQPAIYVSWLDAVDYTQWLSAATGRRYRLLSEAEWEYVARAEQATTFVWGDDLGKANANCQSCGNEFDGKRTVEVHSFRPNNFGLHNMNGNVWEWCADAAEHSYKGAPDDGSSRKGDPTSLRVLRGGAWNTAPINLRPSARYAAPPNGRHDDYGFRIARSMSKP